MCKIVVLNHFTFLFNEQDCVGAIDGTHIPCIPPSAEARRYINRKGYHSQNVMGICDFEMKFTFILTGWEGSAHDARVLLDAISDPEKNFPRPPPGRRESNLLFRSFKSTFEFF